MRIDRRDFLHGMVLSPLLRPRETYHTAAQRRLPDGTILGVRVSRTGQKQRFLIKGKEHFFAGPDGLVAVPPGLFADLSKSRNLRGWIIRAEKSEGSDNLQPAVAPPDPNQKFRRLLEDFPQARFYLEPVRTSAQRYELDPLLILSVIKQESMFGAFMVSKLGAAGEMQILPPTASELGLNPVLYPPDYDRLLYDYLKGNETRRSSAYRGLTRYARSLSRMYERDKEALRARDQRFDTFKNIEAGCQYLHFLRSKLGDLESTLAAYYAGPTDIRSRMKGSILRYVNSVLGFYEFYRA